MRMEKSGVLIFIASLAVVLGIGIVVYKNVKGPPASPAATSTPQNETPPSVNALQIQNQKAGNVVTAAEADLLQTGFVIIKDSQSSVKAVGVSPILAAGKNSLIFITAPISKGKTYYAYLYGDNGNGKFDSGDTVLKGALGNQIIVSFQAF